MPTWHLYTNVKLYLHVPKTHFSFQSFPISLLTQCFIQISYWVILSASIPLTQPSPGTLHFQITLRARSHSLYLYYLDQPPPFLSEKHWTRDWELCVLTAHVQEPCFQSQSHMLLPARDSQWLLIKTDTTCLISLSAHRPSLLPLPTFPRSHLPCTHQTSKPASASGSLSWQLPFPYTWACPAHSS